jgi:ribosomal protein S18 acetylase RimI-like enzyme
VTRHTRRVEIRDAGVDDVREIQNVAGTTWEHTNRENIPEGARKAFVSQAYSTDSLRHRREANVFLVATHDGSVVGFADFRSLSTTEAELAAIYVLPEMQGRGIGARLLQAGISEFPLSTSVMLRVERGNTRARRFYEAHGFRHAGDHAEELGGHVVHEAEMIPHLPDSTPRTVPSKGRIRRK